MLETTCILSLSHYNKILSILNEMDSIYFMVMIYSLCI
jgi:hypothetical protein